MRMPWDERPLLTIRRGRAEPGDAVSVTPCLAAVAETGTLMLVSGAETPTTLNFLPDTHIVVLRAGQVVASYEDGWDLVARSRDADAWPRTINLITGPSRTGDIEQRSSSARTGRAGSISCSSTSRRRRRMRRLAADDRGLWRRAMRDVAPLRGRPQLTRRRRPPDPPHAGEARVRAKARRDACGPTCAARRRAQPARRLSTASPGSIAPPPSG